MEYHEGNFRKEFKTISRVWPKREFQEMLTAVRKQNLIVNKLDGGYTIHAQNGVLVLKAMNGSRGYLVRMVADLFEPEPKTILDEIIESFE